MASGCLAINRKKSSRRTNITWQGCSVSAVTSYGLPVTVAISPSTSPGLAIFRISVFPPLELIESFISPAHSTNTPRGSCFSKNRSEPAGYTVGDVTASKSFIVLGASRQKKLFPFSLQFWQRSVGSKPYGPRILGSFFSVSRMFPRSLGLLCEVFRKWRIGDELGVRFFVDLFQELCSILVDIG